MPKWYLLSIFAILLGSLMLGLDTSLAPGLSLKNAILYAVSLQLTLNAALDPSNGGIFHRPHRFMFLHVAFVAMLAITILSALVTAWVLPYPDYTWVYGIGKVKARILDQYVLFLIFVAGVRNPEDATWLLKRMLALVVMGSLITLVDVLKIVDLDLVTPLEDNRLRGPFGNNSDYATLMIFSTPITIALLYAAPAREKVFWSFALIVYLGVIFTAASRAPIVGLFTAGGIALVALRRFISIKGSLRTVLVFSILAVVAIALLTNEYRELLYQRLILMNFSSDIGSTAAVSNVSSGRYEIWLLALTKMAENPITFIVGNGWETFQQISDYSTHNLYLDFFFGLGTVGLALFLTIYVGAAFALYRAISGTEGNRRTILIGILIGHLGVLVTIVFVNLSSSYIFIWVILGTAMNLLQDTHAAGSSPSSTSAATHSNPNLLTKNKRTSVHP